MQPEICRGMSFTSTFHMGQAIWMPVGKTLEMISNDINNSNTSIARQLRVPTALYTGWKPAEAPASSTTLCQVASAEHFHGPGRLTSEMDRERDESD